MASLFGGGVSLWFALRGGERKLMGLAILSVLPLVLWGFVLHRVIHGG
jgi:hypothetical protein